MSAILKDNCGSCTCTTGSPLIQCKKLVVGYNNKPLLPPVDFTICHGELCAVVGRNGAGKTTWFRTLLGLIPLISGEIHTCTQPLATAHIPQRTQLDPIVPLLAWDVVAMGLERGCSFLNPFLSKNARQQVNMALDELGALNLANLAFRDLSEGQKQRVLMARLLVSKPELAVLDEPMAAMDEVAERETMELINRLRKDHGLTIMIVSHHLPVVSRFADQILFLDRDSKSVVAGPPKHVFSHPVFLARYSHVSFDKEQSHAS